MALNKTAFSKRAEQLKRYEDSETNRESIVPKNASERKVRFSSGCIFLAACAAGDKDEVLNMLNSAGADIDTANVDGLTALHQACIEDNLDMVEFLVTHGADINRKDNEGWTPLHATSSCGIVSIARYLIENGADLASVNSDGELSIDIAGSNAMADLLQRYIDEKGIDCDEARQQEEKTMLADAKKWLRSDASEADRPHPKTGATALHVAAAKGYTKVLSLLLAGRADVDRQDNDGWTPLHAACYWGKKEAAQMLIASMADMEIQNYSNQTPIDIAPKDMTPWLEECKKNSKRTKRRPISQIRISDNNIESIELPPKVIRVEVKSPAEKADETQSNKVSSARDQMQLPLTKDDSSEGRNVVTSMDSSQQPESPPKIVPDKENQNDSEVILRRTQSFENDENKKINEKPTPTSPTTPASTPSSVHLRRSFVPPTRDEESETQRKAHAKRVRETRRSTQGVTLDEIKSAEQLVKMKNANNNNENTENSSELNERLSESSTASSIPAAASSEDSSSNEVAVNYTISSPLRRTFRASVEENDDEQKISATFTISPPPKPNTNSISLLASRLEKGLDLEPANNSVTATINVPLIPNKNTSSVETSDNQKKTELPSHKPVAQPRSLFDIDNATSAKLADKLQQEAKKCEFNDVSEPLPPSPIHHTIFGERRPSWRLKCDSSKFKLEDSKESTSGNSPQPPTSPTNGTIQDPLKTTNVTASPRRLNSTESSSAVEKEAPVTPNRSDDDKDIPCAENDKENDNRSGQATQAMIQRRRRPKRRSTGVVHVDMEDIDPDHRQESPVDNGDDKELSGNESRSRAESLASNALDDGEFIDYKALYEAEKADNERLRQSLKSKEQDLAAAKSALERLTAAAQKSSLSENEKREKRAMERKISEMEEELKQMDALKTENQRLKDENGALIRVISKLSK